MKHFSELKPHIEAIVGKHNFLSAEEDLLTYAYDGTGLEFEPWGVALPGCVEEITAIARLANQYSFAVIPRGAGSGMTGGSLPVYSGLVLALTRMNKILKIDESNMIAFVEPGLITGKLQREVEKRGLFYPPDPSSFPFSTIGGNIAECAGGSRAVKYGVTKDYILGLEAVLPTGELLKTGVQTAKGVVGYDLTKLLVGSEGTLAIITKAIVRLLPLPEARSTLLAVFDDMEAAAGSVNDIMSSRIIPCCLEYMDQASIQCVEDYLRQGLPTDAGALLLIEVDGMNEDVRRSAVKIKDLCLGNGAREVTIAENAAQAEELWRARRSIPPALFRLKPHKISEDITVPRSRLPDMVRRLADIQKTYGLVLVSFGHAGDGNIHVNIMLDKRDPTQAATAKNMVSSIFECALELGGTLSGEHGIGITKAPFLDLEVNELGVDVMKRIKQAFDPNGILNPGKIFVADKGADYLKKIFSVSGR